MKRHTMLSTLMGATVLAAGLGAAPVLANDITITMAAPDWPPTRFMKEHFDQTYVSPDGHTTTLEMDFIPWPSFYERVAASLTSGEQKYQMIVTDSQWLGAFVEGGYYLDLTDKIKADPELMAIMQDLHPALVSAYSTYPHRTRAQLEEAGEVPAPGVSYYGFPQFPDTYVTFYREDIFCDEGEMAAFMEAYGTNLPCSYEDWQDTDWTKWGQIGEFFQRDAGEMLAGEELTEPFYGIAYQAGKGYDFSTMQVNAFVWQRGGDIWDESKAPDAQAEGVVNSEIAVEAFDEYLSYLQYMPPVAQTGQMDIFVIQDLYMQGKVGAIIDWVGLGEPVLDPSASTVHDKSAFAPAPGTRQEDGSIDRTGNIGGQPFVLTTWNSDEVVNEALNVVKWWLDPETQLAAVANGGQSGLMSVMAMPEYNDLRPWNRAHVEMIDWQKDVWHIPEFFEMLTQQQEEFDKAITGQQSAKEALDAVAEFQQELLEDIGMID
ncbi:MAG: ABC transporter substrate-binding protein [Pseudomonadota bacterium]